MLRSYVRVDRISPPWAACAASLIDKQKQKKIEQKKLFPQNIN